MSGRILAGLLVGSLLLDPCTGLAQETERATREKGTVRFEPLDDQHNVPDRYRLEAHTFAYEMTFRKNLPNSGV